MPILVVEDEKKLANFIAGGLRSAQFEVEVVHDGDTALGKLVLRLQAVLRRASGERLTVLHHADVTLNLVTREVRRGTQAIDLSPREFELLEFFLRSAERTLSRMSIIEHVF